MASTTTVRDTSEEHRHLAPKQTRNRSKASCIECYRRKQKCDRKWPCNHCHSRRVGHLCQFSEPKTKARTNSGKSENLSRTRNDSGDGDATRDPTDNDEPRRETATKSLSPAHRSPTPSTHAVAWEKESVDGLGYLQNNDDNLLGYLRTMDLYRDADLKPALLTSASTTLPPEVAGLLRRMPQRSVTDVLIQHFFTEANWIYEMVDITTFLEQYDAWWSHTPRTAQEVEFAALLLRLCSYTAQFLPSQNYTADTILGISLTDLRKDCDSIANEMASSSYAKDAPTSIPRIHQLFFRACYLKNEGDMKRSWNVLGEAIREAQELSLHLELQKGQGRSEYDVEMGKRTYWNLWLWDKFMSIILGRWPLIPEERCTVSLPHNAVGNAASDVNAPDTFSERRLQIELTRLASDLLSCTDGKQSTDPFVIYKHIQRLNTDLIDKLPPAFRMDSPDLKWDEDLPNLRRQRQMFRISVFGVTCSLLKPMIVTPAAGAQAMNTADKQLIAKLRVALIEASIQMLDSVANLHELMGGKQNRFFMLSFFTLEPAALLGMCLLALNGHTNDGKQLTTSKGVKNHSSENQRYWEQGRLKLKEALSRLRMLSEVSSIARTGLKILENITTQLNKSNSKKRPNEAPHVKTRIRPAARLPISPVSEDETAWSQRQIPAASKSAEDVFVPPGAVLFEEPTGLSITPPYSHSDRSQNSSPFDMPDSWTMMGNWPDLDQYHGGQSNAVPPANWDFNLFDNDVVKPALMTTASGPSVPWPSYPPSWGLPTTTACADALTLETQWPLPQTSTTEYGSMEPNMNLAMDQNIDWNWIGDDGAMAFGA